jgi:gas vesicle protein GvpL/GvpF
MTKVEHLKEPEQHSGNPAAAGTRKYLYALIAQGPEQEFGPCGIDGGVVYTIAKGRVAAVVSDLPGEKIRPERRNLAAHQQVLQRLLETTTPLPMAFGVIAQSAKAVEKILSANEQTFLEQLRRLDGKVEMGLRVAWNVPNIFEYFVNTHSELKAARDSLLGRQREPTQEERIEVGRLFDRTLQEDREAYADQLDGILSGHCDEIKRNKCRDEREVMNLACLVEKQALKDFEAGVFEAAQLFDNNFSFNYNGPWAPHNFVTIGLNL